MYTPASSNPNTGQTQCTQPPFCEASLKGGFGKTWRGLKNGLKLWQPNPGANLGTLTRATAKSRAKSVSPRYRWLPAAANHPAVREGHALQHLGCRLATVSAS
eukprot:204714-Amphidinium_carterae.1